MNIFINDQKLDFELENEQNCQDVLNQLLEWLKNNHLKFSGIKINGSITETGFGDIPVSEIENLEIETSLDMDQILEHLEQEISAPDPDTGNISEYLNTIDEYCRVYEKDLARVLDETRVFRIRETGTFERDLKEIYLKECLYLKNIIVHKIIPADNPETVLDQLIESYSEIKPLTELIIDKSRSGLEGETSAAFLKLVEYYQSLTDVFNTLQSEGNNLLGNLDISGESFNEFLSGINSCFEEIISAYENRDSILFTDIMEYEVSEKLENLIISLRTARSGI